MVSQLPKIATPAGEQAHQHASLWGTSQMETTAGVVEARPQTRDDSQTASSHHQMCTGHTVLPSHRHFPINVPIIWTVLLVKAKFICSFWKPSPHVWGRASPRSHGDLACTQVKLKGRLSSLGSTSCDLPGCGRLGAFKELPGVLLLAVIACLEKLSDRFSFLRVSGRWEEVGELSAQALHSRVF